jgi:hypothetical protein
MNSVARPEGTGRTTAGVRLVLTREAEASYARLQEARRVATLPSTGGRPGASTRRAVPLREVYELVIRAFLDRQQAGESIPILAPPESATRRLTWIDADVKTELQEAAKRLDVSVDAVFYTATRAFFGDEMADREAAS